MHIDITNPAFHAQFPTLERIYLTLCQCFVDKPPRRLAEACETAINTLPLPAPDRAAINSLCRKYGEQNGGSELAARICVDVLYEVWTDLQERYNLARVPDAEAPAPQTWPGRVMLLQLIAEQALEIIHAAVLARLPLLSDGDLSALYVDLALLVGVDWGTPPTAAEVEAWQTSLEAGES